MSPSIRDDPDRQFMPGPPRARWSRPREDTQDFGGEGFAESEPVPRAFRPSSERALADYAGVDDRYESDDRYRSSGLRSNAPDGSLPGHWPPNLDPVVMPPPPVQRLRLRGFGIVFKLGGAVVVAACATFAMINAVQIPATGTAAPAGSVDSKNRRPVRPVLESLTEITSAQAKVPAAQELLPQRTEPLPAPAQPNVVAAINPAIELPGITVRQTPLREDPARNDVISKPDTVLQPESAPPPERRTVPAMTRDEILSLLKRGRDLIAAGDVASARLILTRLAESGSAEASLALAGTYDAAVLADLHVVGVRPDPAKARSWYARAAELGSAEASRRLQQSAYR